MSETLLIALLTIGSGFVGAALKAFIDAQMHRRDTLWDQLKTALGRIDALDRRQDELLMRNGELQARVATLESELEHERQRNAQLEEEVKGLRDENRILRSALRARGIPVEEFPVTPHES